VAGPGGLGACWVAGVLAELHVWVLRVALVAAWLKNRVAVAAERDRIW
jgi:hypothetical protein